MSYIMYLYKKYIMGNNIAEHDRLVVKINSIKF